MKGERLVKLFIIGNGFDIGHGLPTRYWDFRTYLSNVKPDFLQSFEEHYDIYPRMSNDAKKKTLWSRFESNLANIDEDSIIDDGTSIEMNLESGDIGIEDTLYSHFTHEYQYVEYVASVGHPESLRLDSCGGENGQSRRFGWTLTAVCA